jgi:hypothetical protein
MVKILSVNLDALSNQVAAMKGIMKNPAGLQKFASST